MELLIEIFVCGFMLRGIYSAYRDFEYFLENYAKKGLEKILNFFFGSLIKKNKKADKSLPTDK